MSTPASRPTVRRVRPSAIVGATLIACVGLTAAPVAHADPLGNVRGAVDGARAQSLCNTWKYSGELVNYAQKWVRTASALATLNTPTFPGAPYGGQTLQWIAQGDPTSTAIDKLMSVSSADIQKCGFYEYGVGMVRDDLTELSYVAVILGKPNAPAPNPGPPVNGLPPAPAAPAPAAPAPVEPKPPAQPKATVVSDVDVYDAPGGNGNVTGILRSDNVVDFLGCMGDTNWCHVTGAAVPNRDGWVWGDFLKR